MTPGTRLLNAARASTRNPSPRENLTERELLAAVEALSDARALYPAAHAIGDRVSVKYPDGLGRQGVVVSVLSFLDGPDQHPATAYGVWLDGESRMNAQTYDSAFVHPAPRTLPLYRAPVVSGGPDWTVEDVVLDPQPAPSWFPMDGRRVTEGSPGEAPYVRMLHAGVHGHEVLDYQEAARHRGEWPSFAASADAVVAAKKEPK